MAKRRGTVRLADPDVRVAVWMQSGGRCGICGRPVTAGYMDINHVVPFAFGGPTALHNLEAAHPTCNRGQGYDIGHGDQPVIHGSIQLRLSPEDHARVAALAVHHERSKQWVALRALRSGLDAMELAAAKQPRP